MSIDPKHIETVAASLAPKPLDYYKGTDALRSYTLRAERILTSTDPDVHAALLAALVRAGVLTEELDDDIDDPDFVMWVYRGYAGDIHDN